MEEQFDNIKFYKDQYSDNKGYKKLLILILVCFAGVFAALIFSGCSLSKKTEKAYDAVGNKYQPLTPKDTGNLAKRFKATFPPTPPVVIQGKTITKTIIKQDNTKVRTLQEKIDSLINEVDFSKELLASVPKIDSLKAAIRAQVLKDCKPTETIIDNSRIDTLFQDTPETTAALWLAKQNESELRKAKEKLEATVADYKEKTGSLWWTVMHIFSFWFVDLTLVLALVAFVYFRRLKSIV